MIGLGENILTAIRPYDDYSYEPDQAGKPPLSLVAKSKQQAMGLV